VEYIKMIIKEYSGLDTSGRKRNFTDANCSVCNKIFTRQTRQMNEYCTCSIKCTSIAKGSTIQCICAHCKIEFTKSKSKVESSRSGLVFCTRACKDLAQTYMPEIQPEHYGTGDPKHSYRDTALKHSGYVCQRCGFDKNKAAIVVHHKDHNRENNIIDNLEVLCANCHAVHHWG
jgi:hypothetical protein